MMRHVPMPNEVHPAYADKPELLDFVEGRGRFAGSDLKIPQLTRPTVTDRPEDEYPTSIAPRAMTMTRHRCAGPAPYVGRPFRYEWWVGIDDAKRAIAGEARIVYADFLYCLERGLPYE